MRKRNIVRAASVVIGLALTGCFTKDYGHKDIEEFLGNYAEEYLPSDGMGKFTISEDCIEQQGEDGYTDQVWEVTAAAPDGGELRFHVIDDYAWRGEALSNYLWTDYEDVLLVHYMEKYDSDNTNHDKSSQLGLEKREDGEIVYARLACSYEDRADLQNGYEEVLAFEEFVREHGCREADLFTVVFQMQNPLRNAVAQEGSIYEMDDGDFRMSVTSAGEEEYLFQSGERKFIRTCADYRLEDLLEDFTQEEIEEALNEENYRIGIHEPGMEDGVYRTLPGLSASNFGYGVSFGGLYRILHDCGEQERIPEGNPWHYSFVGTDGAEYEISYDFHQFNEMEPERDSYYYYLRDGEVVWMDYFFYNHFTIGKVREMTGLDLCIGENEDGVIYGGG